MPNTDPLLKQLVADATAAEESVPLDLYLPSGQLYGRTTTVEDFCGVVTDELGQQSDFTGTVVPAPDPEYVHLVVRPLTMPGQDGDSDVVRVRLADVIAWTVG
jgi:hypothetical protein